MTDTETAQVQQIREREQQATPGPWDIEHEYPETEYAAESYPYALVGPLNVTVKPDTDYGRRYGHKVNEICEMGEADAQFIAHARKDIPDLLDLLARQQAEIDRLKGAMRAQDEREQQAAATLGMVHTCDWPDDVADRVQGLQAEIDRLRGERDKWRGRAWTSERLRLEDGHRHINDQLQCESEVQDLRARLASALAEREEALLSIGGVRSDLRKAEFSLSALREALTPFATLKYCEEDEANCESYSGQYCAEHGDNGLHADLILAARRALLASPTPEDR